MEKDKKLILLRTKREMYRQLRDCEKFSEAMLDKLNKDKEKSRRINLLLLRFVLPIFVIITLSIFIKELRISCILFIIGMTCNALAFFSNRFRMPVKAFSDKEADNRILSDRHFVFFDSTKIRFYHLSDIFYLRLKKKIIAYSVGDVIICLGMFFYLIAMIVMVMHSALK